MEDARPFAVHGGEKMIYDVRMGPQCLYRNGAFWVAYQANPEGSKALPHVIQRDLHGSWSDPVCIGDVARPNHHYAPVIWFDREERIHLLYHCHFELHGARHLISAAPRNITRWEDVHFPVPSISYPRLLRCPDNRLVLYYRALGHMGYWTYRVSEDDGYTWLPPARPVVDFDQAPEVPGDEWAGSYHSVALARDGESLHIAFVYWDERDLPHPLYGKRVGLLNRYNLYYLRLDLRSGRVFTIEGKRLETPLNRKAAGECLVWDTEGRLSNMPSILVDEDDSPCFLVPCSEDAINRCRFWFVRRQSDRWTRRPVAPTDSTWNGSHLEAGEDGALTAFLIGEAGSVGQRAYGGGPLQEWRSLDHGRTWQQVGDITPQVGLLCNNPKPVERVEGVPLKRSLVFFGWTGPNGILPEGPFKGRAYLWHDGKWL